MLDFKLFAGEKVSLTPLDGEKDDLVYMAMLYGERAAAQEYNAKYRNSYIDIERL
jgi:hypothetical protein